MKTQELGFYLSTLPQTDLGIEHHFSDGLYAKQMHLPKGHIAVSHKHRYSHLSILSEGMALVKKDGAENFYIAPACIEIKANVQHSIEAIEDIVWFCIHSTNETNQDLVDKVLIKEK